MLNLTYVLRLSWEFKTVDANQKVNPQILGKTQHSLPSRIQNSIQKKPRRHQLLMTICVFGQKPKNTRKSHRKLMPFQIEF